MRWLAVIPLALGIMMASVTASQGHALQPGYLELTQIDKDVFKVIWKNPASRGSPMPMTANLPQQCLPASPPPAHWNGVAYVVRWIARCSGGLAGRTIHIDGLEKTMTDVLVRFKNINGSNQTHRLTPNNTSFIVTAEPGPFEVMRTYLFLGVEHILFGFDHVLFVIALLLLVKGTRKLIMTVTAFTIAHSITLAAATLGVVQVPAPPLEAIIALSVVFVAAEIIRSQRGNPGLMEQFPWVVAFLFGLLHGFGFAGALSEIGLPRDAITLALLFFNIGVEIGQLAIIGLVLLTVGLTRHLVTEYNQFSPIWAPRIMAYAIGSISAFWVIERVAAFV